jgi:predicted patatin/cPLA2 family phospholipase
MAGNVTVRDQLLARPGGPRSGLVVQGGGMRGIYSMGALAALEEAGLREAFDIVVGSSSGAINAAYFLAGQAAEAIDLYLRYLNSREFINVLRLWRIADIDFVVDTAMKTRRPLKTEALRISPSLLEIVVADADTGQPEVISSRDDRYDLYEVMRATAAMPGLYNKKVRLGGRLYVDGGLVDAFPVGRALDSGAERILAIATRPHGYRDGGNGSFFRLVARMLARGQAPAVQNLLGRPNLLLNETMRLLENQAEAHGWCVWPSDRSRLVSRTTRDRFELSKCAAMGRSDMRRLLDRKFQENH